jgi:hypothetical protein
MQPPRPLVFNYSLATSSANSVALSKPSNKISACLCNQNDERSKDEDRYRLISLSIRTRPPSRNLMLERREKFKHFFITFLTREFAKGKVVVS